MANTGTGTRASPCFMPIRVKYQPTPSTTGSSRNTRNSLTITAVLPTARRDGVAGADHLGDVMDRAAQHHAGSLRIEAEQDAERRIDQHGDGRQRIDRHHDEGDVRLLAGIVRDHRRHRQRRRSAAHRGADADQRAEARPAPVPFRENETRDQSRYQRHHDQNGGAARARRYRQAHTQAQQRHRPAQHRADAEAHAGQHGRTRGERIERDADHQRDHHVRNGNDMGDIRRGQIADAGDERRQGHARGVVRQPGP